MVVAGQSDCKDTSVSSIAAWLLAIGFLDGLGIAVKQIARQQYTAQGLWWTSLWTLCHETLTGTLLAAIAGIVLLASLLCWPRVVSSARRLIDIRVSDPPASLTPSLLGLAFFFALVSGAAVLLIPVDAPPRVPPYSVFAAICFAGLWLSISGVAAWTFTTPAGTDESAAFFRLRWLTLLGVAYVTAVLHIRASPTSEGIALPAALWLLGSVVTYVLLYRPARIAGRLISKRLGVLRRAFQSPWIPLGILLAGALLWGGGLIVWEQASARAATRGENVLIIAVDTLRADRVSLLSGDEHERDLTPNLRKAFAERAVVFSHATSQAPWTLPAFASILTGLYPEQHGAEEFTSRLRPRQLTLPEILREAGYRTGAVVSAYFVSSAVGIDQGFEYFDESLATDNTSITSEEVTQRAVRFLQNHGREPFLLFAHYFDPHIVYQDHADFSHADDYHGWLREEAACSNQAGVIGRKRHLFGPEEVAYIRSLYDEEVAYTDKHIGRLMRFLDETDLQSRTLVVFVSDHGEEFLEHGDWDHITTVYQELAHVPLAIAVPGATSARVVARPVETRWLFATILDYLRVANPNGVEPSMSLLGDELSEDALVRCATHPWLRPDSPGAQGGSYVWLTSLVGRRWKIIRDHIMQRVMLFDLSSDPGETADLSEAMPDLRRQLEQSLDARNGVLHGERGEAHAADLSEEQLRRLRALGYL